MPWVNSTGGPELDFVARAGHPAGCISTEFWPGPNGEGTSQSAAFVSGTVARLRAESPHETPCQTSPERWNVQNGRGGKVFAKRIDDRLGYGEILPAFALTVTPPAGAANPI